VKKADVRIGGTYIVKVSGKLTRVRLTRESPYGGWDGLNLATQREVRIRSAARLRAPVGQYRPARLNTTTPRLSPAERGITLDFIRAWRQDRFDRHEPSGLRDCFVDLGLCPDCQGRGQLRATEECVACGGTGLVRSDPAQ
jgi:hypothetical protein